MNDPLPIDLFMTKAAEYLLVIGFLATFVVFWRLLARRQPVPCTPLPPGPAANSRSGWFSLPLERLYHLGHGWARPTGDGTVELGADDFAQKLVGRADAITLPEPGTRVVRGQPLSHHAIDGKTVRLRSPLDGEVVARNDALLANPGLVNDDPYGKGWLVRVKPSRWDGDAGELLQGREAKAWIDAAEDDLQRRMSPSFGLLLQDGGVPVTGIARVLAGDEWDRLARELL